MLITSKKKSSCSSTTPQHSTHHELKTATLTASGPNPPIPTASHANVPCLCLSNCHDASKATSRHRQGQGTLGGGQGGEDRIGGGHLIYRSPVTSASNATYSLHALCARASVTVWLVVALPWPGYRPESLFWHEKPVG